jgi:hypothetical protein
LQRAVKRCYAATRRPVDRRREARGVDDLDEPGNCRTRRPAGSPLGGNASINAATLNTIAAAQKIGGDIHGLVGGHNAQAAADAAAKLAGVSKVLLADTTQLEAGSQKTSKRS